jgi:hypothetical protein
MIEFLLFQETKRPGRVIVTLPSLLTEESILRNSKIRHPVWAGRFIQYRLSERQGVING